MSFAQAAANARRITINTAKIREAESALETERSVAANDALGPQMPQTYWDKYQAETESFINRSKAAQGVVGGVESQTISFEANTASKNRYEKVAESARQNLSAESWDLEAFRSDLLPSEDSFLHQNFRNWRKDPEVARTGVDSLLNALDVMGDPAPLDRMEIQDLINAGYDSLDDVPEDILERYKDENYRLIWYQIYVYQPKNEEDAADNKRRLEDVEDAMARKQSFSK